MPSAPKPIDWVVLTRGDRPVELEVALESILREPSTGQVVVVANTADPVVVPEVSAANGRRASNILVRCVGDNIGVPAGRHLGLEETTADFVGFLDDDATLLSGAAESALDAFDDDDVAVVSMRIVDESRRSTRRHVPRVGGRDARTSGRVVGFLGGACVIRRRAYDEAGGYWGELFYSHEEIELAWRLADLGWAVEYVAESVVQHPATTIARHESGWARTGRNRVGIARRTLPAVVAAVHVSVWLAVGAARASAEGAGRAYIRGWLSGWRMPVRRAPIRWRTVWLLTRLGRPPFI